VRARYDDQPHAHLAIAVQGPGCYDQESVALSVAQVIIGSWDLTYGAGKNMASKLAAACGEFGAAHSFESFYHKFSDTGLWYILSVPCIFIDHVAGEIIRLVAFVRVCPFVCARSPV